MNKVYHYILGIAALMALPFLATSCDDAEKGISYRTTAFPVGEVHWNGVSSDDQVVITGLINKMIKVEACHFYMGAQSQYSTRANYSYGFATKDSIWNRFNDEAYWRDLKTKDTIWFKASSFNFIDTITTKRESIRYTTVYRNGACWVGPVIEVTMPDFYIGKFEITQREWEAVMHREPTGKYCVIQGHRGQSWYDEIGKGDDIAAYNIWHEDAVEFCETLSAKTGLNFRLPTEAEWECAARGGKYARGYKFAGSDDSGEAGWTYHNSAATGYSEGEETNYGIHKGGLKLPNELGIYDMCGNVSEWVSNAYYRYDASVTNNPQGTPVLNNGQDTLILRGGSWMQKKSMDFSMGNRKYCIMSSYPSEESKHSAFVNCGFRICISR